MPDHWLGSKGQETPDAARRFEVAAYIASMSGDLSLMARRSGLATLGYLLEMARLEADAAARAGDAGGDVRDSTSGPVVGAS